MYGASVAAAVLAGRVSGGAVARAGAARPQPVVQVLPFQATAVSTIAWQAAYPGGTHPQAGRGPTLPAGTPGDRPAGRAGEAAAPAGAGGAAAKAPPAVRASAPAAASHRGAWRGRRLR